MTNLVVVGLGYVGLPLVVEASKQGLLVVGLDANSKVVDSLNAGHSHVDDLTDADIAALLGRGFHATTDASVISDADVVVICVPTPLSAEGGPDLAAVEAASRDVGRWLRPGTLVVLESTTWPGTTDEVVRPILEEHGLLLGHDFHLAFSPERIDPGNARFQLSNTPKVVGGVTPECSKVAAAFYEQVIDTVVVAKGAREAEMAKLLENTYRHINIALVNEMLKFSHELGIDFWDVVRCAATKPFGFQSFKPGPGVGGHCIPIDPNYLSHRVKSRLGYPFRFVELAQEVNLSMPRYVLSRIAELLNDCSMAVRGSSVLLLGVTYKAGISDQRESPALPLAELLHRQGATVDFHDPFVQTWKLPFGTKRRVEALETNLERYDVIVLLQDHPVYTSALLGSSGVPILDTRGVLEGQRITRL